MKLTRKNIIFFSHFPNKSRFEKWSIINSHSFPLIFFPSILSEESVPFVVLFYDYKKSDKIRKKPSLIFPYSSTTAIQAVRADPCQIIGRFIVIYFQQILAKKGVSREHPTLSREKKI